METSRCCDRKIQIRHGELEEASLPQHHKNQGFFKSAFNSTVETCVIALGSKLA
jgi:hypothetical protein